MLSTYPTMRQSSYALASAPVTQCARPVPPAEGFNRLLRSPKLPVLPPASPLRRASTRTSIPAPPPPTIMPFLPRPRRSETWDVSRLASFLNVIPPLQCDSASLARRSELAPGRAGPRGRQTPEGTAITRCSDPCKHRPDH